MARDIKRHQTGQSREQELQSGDEEEYTWLLTYSDMVTLLLVFFISMISMSNFDINLFEQFKEGLRSEVTGTDTPTPLREVKADLDSLLSDERKKGTVSIDIGREGIIMQFSSENFYRQGEAQMLDQGQRIIDKVLNALTTERIQKYQVHIGVEGHTDDVPIKTERFPSNWELSSTRASNVVKYFIDQGIEPDRLQASGFAYTQPLVPNRDAMGNPIPENQAKNRRITLRIYYPRDTGGEE